MQVAATFSDIEGKHFYISFFFLKKQQQSLKSKSLGQLPMGDYSDRDWGQKWVPHGPLPLPRPDPPLLQEEGHIQLASECI